MCELVSKCERERHTSVVLYQRNLHPALCRQMVVGVIEHALSADSQILPARQVKLPLVVPHPYLVASLEEVAIRLVDKDIHQLELLVKLHLPPVLLEHRVGVAKMM